MRTLLQTCTAAADLLLGARCPGCLRPGTAICGACVEELRASQVGPAPRAASPALPIWAAGPYSTVARRLLAELKERRRRSLAGPLGARLAAAVAGLSLAYDVAEPLVLVPMPSRAASVRRRTYDAVGLLAEVAAETLTVAGLAVGVRPVLTQVRRVADQSGLDRDERRRNLAGALRAGRVDGALVVVVDDIVTTGASLAEATRSLRHAGCQVLGAATVAATVKRR